MPDHAAAERARLEPGQRIGFDFTEEPDPGRWFFDYCTEWEEVGEEAACAGCAGWGVDCWSVWTSRP